MGSTFTGKRREFVALRIVDRIAKILSSFLLSPAVYVVEAKYIASHTYIDGYALEFKGTLFESYCRHALWFFLSVITLLIYVPFVSGARQKWTAERTFLKGGLIRAPSALMRETAELFTVNCFTFLINFLTLGILRVEALMIKSEFNAARTVYSARRVYFAGKKRTSVYVGALLSALLRLLTIGIYSVFEDFEIIKWRAQNSSFKEQCSDDKRSRVLDFLLKHKYAIVCVVAAFIFCAAVALFFAVVFVL